MIYLEVKLAKRRCGNVQKDYNYNHGINNLKKIKPKSIEKQRTQAFSKQVKKKIKKK